MQIQFLWFEQTWPALTLNSIFLPHLHNSLVFRVVDPKSHCHFSQLAICDPSKNHYKFYLCTCWIQRDNVLFLFFPQAAKYY